jgi:hypothetical protein
VNIQANISLFREFRLPGMDADTNANIHIIRPVSGENCTLCSNGGCHGVNGTLKDDEEGISLGIDFVAVSQLKCRAQQASAISQHTGILITELL